MANLITRTVDRLRRIMLDRPAATSEYVIVPYSLTERVRDLPVWHFGWGRKQLVDPTLRLGLAMKMAPLHQAQFGEVRNSENGKPEFVPGVSSPQPDVALFVESQLKKIWRNYLHKILDSQTWGWSAGEVTYRLNSSGKVVIDRFLKRSSMDTVALTRHGRVSSVKFLRLSMRAPRGDIALPFPKAWWHAYDPEDESPYGRSVLRGSFSPWCDKWLEGGALDVRRLFAHKDAYGGMSIGYPEGTTLIDGQHVPNRDVVRQMVEQAKAGHVITKPSNYNRDGTDAWPITYATVPNNPTHIFQYPKDLDIEELRGLEIPDDVIVSDKTGAWQGKQVPMLAFFVNADRWLAQVLATLTEQLLEPLVLVNWGQAVDFDIGFKPLAQQAMEQMQREDNSQEPQAGQSRFQIPGQPQQSFLPSPGQQLNLTPDTSVAEQLVGAGTIQAEQLVAAGRRMMGLMFDQTAADVTDKGAHTLGPKQINRLKGSGAGNGK